MWLEESEWQRKMASEEMRREVCVFHVNRTKSLIKQNIYSECSFNQATNVQFCFDKLDMFEILFID